LTFAWLYGLRRVEGQTKYNLFACYIQVMGTSMHDNSNWLA